MGLGGSEGLRLSKSALTCACPSASRQDPPPAQEGAAHTGPEGSDAKEEEAAMGTYISDSTTVTSADEEKLLLLNRNTELRRINKEVSCWPGKCSAH